MIKVFLKRRVAPKNYRRLLGLLTDLRSLALRQPGYVLGETLIRGTDPVEVLAIGTWISEEHWMAWSTSQRRIEITDLVSPLLVGAVETTIYKIPTGDAAAAL